MNVYQPIGQLAILPVVLLAKLYSNIHGSSFPLILSGKSVLGSQVLGLSGPKSISINVISL